MQGQKFTECWVNPFRFLENNLRESPDYSFIQFVCKVTNFRRIYLDSWNFVQVNLCKNGYSLNFWPRNATHTFDDVSSASVHRISPLYTTSLRLWETIVIIRRLIIASNLTSTTWKTSAWLLGHCLSHHTCEIRGWTNVCEQRMCVYLQHTSWPYNRHLCFALPKFDCYYHNVTPINTSHGIMFNLIRLHMTGSNSEKH